MPWASGTDGAGQESSLEGKQGAAGFAVKTCGSSSSSGEEFANEILNSKHMCAAVRK